MITKIFFVVFLIVFSNSKCQENVTYTWDDKKCDNGKVNTAEECDVKGTDNPKFTCCMAEIKEEDEPPFCLAIVNNDESFKSFRDNEPYKNTQFTCGGKINTPQENSNDTNKEEKDNSSSLLKSGIALALSLILV